MSGDTRRGPGPVGEPSRSSGTSRRTLGEVWDGSRDTMGGPLQDKGPLGRSGMGQGTFRRSRTGQRTLGEFRNRSGTLEEVRECWVTSGRYGKGRRTLEQILGRLGTLE